MGDGTHARFECGDGLRRKELVEQCTPLLVARGGTADQWRILIAVAQHSTHLCREIRRHSGSARRRETRVILQARDNILVTSEHPHPQDIAKKDRLLPPYFGQERLRILQVRWDERIELSGGKWTLGSHDLPPVHCMDSA